MWGKKDYKWEVYCLASTLNNLIDVVTASGYRESQSKGKIISIVFLTLKTCAEEAIGKQLIRKKAEVGTEQVAAEYLQ